MGKIAFDDQKHPKNNTAHICNTDESHKRRESEREFSAEAHGHNIDDSVIKSETIYKDRSYFKMSMAQ